MYSALLNAWWRNWNYSFKAGNRENSTVILTCFDLEKPAQISQDKTAQMSRHACHNNPCDCFKGEHMRHEVYLRRANLVAYFPKYDFVGWICWIFARTDQSHKMFRPVCHELDYFDSPRNTGLIFKFKSGRWIDLESLARPHRKVISSSVDADGPNLISVSW